MGYRARLYHDGDHPRLRGEHAVWLRCSPQILGSSPLTRGALSGRGFSMRPCGIIPAYAGSTVHRFDIKKPRRDHPRLRGEHSSDIPLLPLPTGSSPLTRGAPLLNVHSAGKGGIIPAYAGSTILLMMED